MALFMQLVRKAFDNSLYKVGKTKVKTCVQENFKIY